MSRQKRFRWKPPQKMKPYLVILIAAAVAVSAPAQNEKKHDHQAHSPMAAMIIDKQGAEFEAAFLAMMSHHHQGGSVMWKLAREKTKNKTLLELEAKTTPKEKQEVEQMTQWLKDWHNKAPQDFMEPAESTQMMEKDMAALKAADGKEFDRLFAEKMAHHHAGAIEMGKLAADKAQHEEVKKFAGKLVKAQSEDREQLLEIAKL